MYVCVCECVLARIFVNLLNTLGIHEKKIRIQEKMLTNMKKSNYSAEIDHLSLTQIFPHYIDTFLMDFDMIRAFLGHKKLEK